MADFAKNGKSAHFCVKEAYKECGFCKKQQIRHLFPRASTGAAPRPLHVAVFPSSCLVHRKVNNWQFGLPAICPAASEKLADAWASPAFSFLACQTAFVAKLSSIYFTVY